ncbi:MAG TPA: type II toxin-antitoxin system RelE/ParE family toxin [Terriglobales bacterium]|nr:type II toxin-antitoxin system RelE/ParE family toxin [Terriglobales bacterium]
MQYSIEFAASALRELRALDRPIQRRISAKIEGLRENPFPPGVRKFQGEKDHWRIRIGDYRIIYRVEKQRVVIVIVRIGHRREVYR